MPQENSVWLATYAVNQVTNWVALLGATAGTPPLMANGAAPPVAQPWTSTGYVLCTNFGYNFNTGVPSATNFGDYLVFTNIAATNGEIVILDDADGLAGRVPLNGFELVAVSGGNGGSGGGGGGGGTGGNGGNGNGITNLAYGVQFLGSANDPVTGYAGVLPINGWNSIANASIASGSQVYITCSDGSQLATLTLSGRG